MSNGVKNGTSDLYLAPRSAQGGKVRHSRPWVTYLVTRLANCALFRFADDLVNGDRYRGEPEDVSPLRWVDCFVDRCTYLPQAYSNCRREKAFIMGRHVTLAFVRFFWVIHRGFRLSPTGVRGI